MKFLCGQCTGKRRVCISIYQHPIRFLFYQNLFYPLQHLPGHSTMPQSVYVQIIMWLRYAHLFKKDITHVGVKMLTCMYYYLCYVFRSCKNTTHNRSFYKLRTCSNNCYYFHFSIRLFIISRKRFPNT